MFLSKLFNLIVRVLCPIISNTERLYIIEISIKIITPKTVFYMEIEHRTVSIQHSNGFPEESSELSESRGN